MAPLVLLLFLVLPLAFVSAELCTPQDAAYQTAAGPVPGMLNVHLVPHTHDDVGWLKTVDQYYVGSNNSIQVAAVQYILDSVVSSLLEDRNRKFVYVEQAFFQRWWRVQSKAKQEAVRKLVEDGQLEFINGAWCMHDEATTHYIDMIDQTALGHRFIKQQFNKVPRIGWQIDPFGHSSVQAYLLGAELGFDAVFFARGDYQDVAKRRRDRSMEFIWRASESLGESSEIFGGVLAHHYDPPNEFRYDIHNTEPPIQDDPLLFDYNVPDRVDLFVKYAQDQAAEFRTEHIMWTMGEDFAYENANTWFKQMDKLIHYVNKDGRVNAFYSTPSAYLDAKYAANETWPLKSGDFFPYADSAASYWTGYFSSRPGLKGYVRKLSGYLLAARQLEFLLGRNAVKSSTDSLEEALAILQHHDGVSGTEKQHVADDYAKRLAIGAAESADILSSALTYLLQGNAPRTAVSLRNEVSEAYPLHRRGLEGSQKQTSGKLKIEQCPLLNVSYCPPSEREFGDGKVLALFAYNSLAWTRKEWIRLPVTSDLLEVTDELGITVPSQLVPVNEYMVNKLQKLYVRAHLGISANQSASYTLVFQASVPPLGYTTFFIRETSAARLGRAELSTVETADLTGHVDLNSENLRLRFSTSSGHLQAVSQVKTRTVIDLEQSYCWYNGSAGNADDPNHQASGAYILRPNSSTCFPVGEAFSAPLKVVKGALVEEVHQQFAPWISQVIRLYKNSEFAEVEFSIGPIPVDDSLGKEVVTKFSTSIASQGKFFTDSNGRDFIARVRDYRSDWKLNVTQPVAGNYYPLNLGMYLRDEDADFSLLVDRAVGGASLADGQLEVMVHRRLLHDDGKGVGEALNETVCIQDTGVCEGLTVNGVVLLGINAVKEAPKWRRSLGQRLLAPLQLAFTVLEDDAENRLNTLQFSAVDPSYELPPNVALITLQEIEEDEILVRLAHLYEVGEDDELSQVSSVPLQSLLPVEIKEVVELSLSGNQARSEMKRLKWRAEESGKVTEKAVRGGPVGGHPFVVELGPMEIRTFRISL